MEINGVLKKIGVKIKIQDIINKYNEKKVNTIKNKFTLSNKNHITKFIQKVKLFKICKKEYLILPRFGAYELLESGIIDNIINKIKPGYDIIQEYTGKSNNNQQIIVKYIMDNIFNDEKKQNGNAGCTLHCGAGCHIKDTKIIMYNGDIKKVQDIKIGELLMGDDSTPRNVLQLCRGKEIMYKITNTKNESYIVNENHILCLKYSIKKSILDYILRNAYIIRWFDNKLLIIKSKHFNYNNKNKDEIYNIALEYLNNIKEDLIVETTVKEYLQFNKSLKKNLKGYKVPINFKEKELPLDPYMIGYWLGDGTSSIPAITSQDSTILNYFSNNLKQYKCYLQYQSKYYYRINGEGTNKVGSNYFMNILKKLNLINNKHIPHIYKCNSRENQLKLLAGLIDSDGCYDKKGKIYEFTQKNEIVMDDVIYLCRSLGFACYKKLKKTSWTHKEEKKYGSAWIISISGEGIEDIPVLCPRKVAEPRKQIKDVLVSGIKVEKMEEEEYYGFCLDSNKRYIMGDFTVTHNTGKTYIAMDLISKINKKTLIIVPNTFLLKQWIELLKQYFPNNTIGEYYSKTKKDGDIIVSIINSAVLEEFTFKTKIDKKKIVTTLTPLEYYNQFGLVIFDESHTYCSNTFKQIFNRCQCDYMLGLTATPNERIDTFDKISHMNIGDVLDVEQIENYIKNDVIFESTINVIKYNGPEIYTQVEINPRNNMMNVPHIINQLIEDEYRNQLIIDNIIKLSKEKLNIFIFSERRNHLLTLYDLLSEQIENECEISIPEEDKSIVLYGGSSNDDINEAKHHSNVIFTTYQYSSTGVSIVKMNALILATPRKSNSTQIIGRVFRLGAGQDVHRRIIDIVDNKIPLKYQFYQRKKTYINRNSKITTTEVNYQDIEVKS
jgi:superfamily II DNA or RNA helicase